MKFRRSVQQPKYVEEPKSIAPTLLSDPAFSPDPHLNPYYVLNGEPAEPPVGHPSLKAKNRRRHSGFAQPILASDSFDFDLIPPPNSPVAPSPVPTTAHFPFPAHNPLPVATETPPASQPPVATHTRASVAFATVTLPKEHKKRRMSFLSRRKSSVVPVEPPRAAAVPTRNARAENDVTQQTRPVFASRNASEPPKSSTRTKPGFPMRSMTVSGASTPTARSVGKSIAASQISNARTQDLDRIDELDDTNPWGISLHHKGPYEAANQALKSSNSSTVWGTGTSAFSDYPRQALHAHGNLYVPPQVPTGVSLNLSPGQILPRNFDISPQAQYPRPQASASRLPLNRQPPNVVIQSTPMTRRVSLPIPSPGPLPNPHPMVYPFPPRDPVLPREPQPSSLPAPEPEASMSEAMQFDIGMAMLHPAASASVSSIPSIYLHPETSDGGEFDPYDPVNLEREHSRTPSLHLNSSAEQSRGPSPDPQPERLIPQPSIFRSSPENPDTTRQQSPIPRGPGTPPPYNDGEFTVPPFLQPAIPNDPSRTALPNTNHMPPSSALHENHNEKADPVNLISGRFENTPLLNPQDRTENFGEISSAQNSQERVYTLGPTPIQRLDSNAQLVSQMPPTQEPNRNTRSINSQGYDSRSDGQNTQVTPAQRTGERGQKLGPPFEQDRDAPSSRYAPSTHQTISTYSSSQMRNGPPPNRHVPKHLVMPTPLQNNPNIMSHQNRPQMIAQPVLPSQFGSTKVQVQVRTQPRAPYLQPPYSQTQQLFAPVQSGPPPTPNKLISSSKLRKKLSTKMMTSAPDSMPPPPIVTTVSFAPPVIGFSQSASAEKHSGRSKIEKIPKRVLSKRRTDL